MEIEENERNQMKRNEMKETVKGGGGGGDE